jgi:hypothetical protein
MKHIFYFVENDLAYFEESSNVSEGHGSNPALSKLVPTKLFLKDR